MSVDRRLLNWGIFLVLLGGVPLAVAQGWIPKDVVEQAWELWPLILIGAGIGLILSRTPLAALGGIIVAGTFGIILGGVLAVGIGGFSFGGLGCGAADPDAPVVVDEQGTFEGGRGSMVLVASCAGLDLATAPGSGWDVTVRGTESARPSVQRAADRLEVRSPEGPVVVPFNVRRATWQATIGTDAAVDLVVEVNAGEADLDLSGATLTSLQLRGNAVGETRVDLRTARVDRLDASVNAAAVDLLLPETADLVGTVDANAASVTLCASPDVGLRLIVDENITTSNNYGDAGLVRSGNTWETPGYATAATKIELRTGGGAASFTLDTTGGCR